jgi:hypothetical protein
VSCEFRNWIVTHIEGEETDRRIVEELEGLEEEDLVVALETLSKLGYVEEKPKENPFW